MARPINFFSFFFFNGRAGRHARSCEQTQLTTSQSTLQLVLLSSISDEELTQTIGVICSSMGGGGLALLHSHECTEFITRAAQMVSGCLSQVQVHVQETSCRETGTWPGPASQTDRQTLLTRDTAIVPSRGHDAVVNLPSFLRRPGQSIAGMRESLPMHADVQGRSLERRNRTAQNRLLI